MFMQKRIKQFGQKMRKLIQKTAIEQGKAVSLKTSKSLERTAYLYNGNFYMLTDYNEMIICFKYSQKQIKIN